VITHDEAERIADAYEERTQCARGDASEQHETLHWWFFPRFFIGSKGIIIDREDGRVMVLGSALKLDDCFWGHDRGFSGDLRFRILSVRDEANTQRFLDHIAMPNPFRGHWPLKDQPRPDGPPPWDFGPQPGLWLRIPAFRRVEPHAWFTYELGDRRWVDTSVPREPIANVDEWPFPDPVAALGGPFRSGDRVFARAERCLPRRERTPERIEELAGLWWPGRIEGPAVFGFDVALDRGGRRMLRRKDLLTEDEYAQLE